MAYTEISIERTRYIIDVLNGEPHMIGGYKRHILTKILRLRWGGEEHLILFLAGEQ